LGDLDEDGEDNAIMDFRVMSWEVVKWIQLALDRDQ
jgi:hypothetical protein